MILGPQSPITERATDKAARFRAKAEELRLAAATVATMPSVRSGYLDMAAQYEAMADKLLKR
jgi:hypothetical protein